jgi:hypothetical protein
MHSCAGRAPGSRSDAGRIVDKVIARTAEGVVRISDSSGRGAGRLRFVPTGTEQAGAIGTGRGAARTTAWLAFGGTMAARACGTRLRCALTCATLGARTSDQPNQQHNRHGCQKCTYHRCRFLSYQIMGIWPQHGGIAMGLRIDVALAMAALGSALRNRHPHSTWPSF